MQLLQQAFVLELMKKQQYVFSRWRERHQLVSDVDVTVCGQADTQGKVTGRFGERSKANLYGFVHRAKCRKNSLQETLARFCRNYRYYRRSAVSCEWLQSLARNRAPSNFENKEGRSNEKIGGLSSWQTLLSRRSLIISSLQVRTT